MYVAWRLGRKAYELLPSCSWEHHSAGGPLILQTLAQAQDALTGYSAACENLCTGCTSKTCLLPSMCVRPASASNLQHLLVNPS